MVPLSCPYPALLCPGHAAVLTRIAVTCCGPWCGPAKALLNCLPLRQAAPAAQPTARVWAASVSHREPQGSSSADTTGDPLPCMAQEQENELSVMEALLSAEPRVVVNAHVDLAAISQFWNSAVGFDASVSSLPTRKSWVWCEASPVLRRSPQGPGPTPEHSVCSLVSFDVKDSHV